MKSIIHQRVTYWANNLPEYEPTYSSVIELVFGNKNRKNDDIEKNEEAGRSIGKHKCKRCKIQLEKKIDGKNL